ncbi:hypothetical protein J6590_052194 [Homalodisca vitripennis]|nr:hypothetical protein J6590_052194 [Homalodisca vitripennis]
MRNRLAQMTEARAEDNFRDTGRTYSRSPYGCIRGMEWFEAAVKVAIRRQTAAPTKRMTYDARCING